MSGAVSLPLWLFVVLVALAAGATLDRLLVPSSRRMIRRRVNRMLERLNTQLKIRIPPFKVTRRDILIDRLRFDPQIAEAIAREARERGAPREVVARDVDRYAREIVPSFN